MFQQALVVWMWRAMMNEGNWSVVPSQVIPSGPEATRETAAPTQLDKSKVQAKWGQGQWGVACQ